MDNSKLIHALNLILDNARETRASLENETISERSGRIASINVLDAARSNYNQISMLESLISELKQ